MLSSSTCSLADSVLIHCAIVSIIYDRMFCIDSFTSVEFESSFNYSLHLNFVPLIFDTHINIFVEAFAGIRDV